MAKFVLKSLGSLILLGLIAGGAYVSYLGITINDELQNLIGNRGTSGIESYTIDVKTRNRFVTVTSSMIIFLLTNSAILILYAIGILI